MTDEMSEFQETFGPGGAYGTWNPETGEMTSTAEEQIAAFNEYAQTIKNDYGGNASESTKEQIKQSLGISNEQSAESQSQNLPEVNGNDMFGQIYQKIVGGGMAIILLIMLGIAFLFSGGKN